MLRPTDACAVEFGQTVYIIIVLSSQSEVLRQVDDTHIGRNIMVVEELRTLAVTEAEEDDVHLVKRQPVGKTKVGLTEQSGMNIGNEIAGVALAIDEDDFCFRVIEQKAA